MYHQNESKLSTNDFTRKLANDRKLSKLAAKFPLLKILKMVQRKFMFNELEIYLFSFFLDNTGWDYNVLIPEATYLPEFIINVEVQDF